MWRYIGLIKNNIYRFSIDVSKSITALEILISIKIISLIVPKTFGPWENDGACQAIGQNPECGPGVQAQIRSCTDGIIEKCTEVVDTERSVPCSSAGTTLPECPPRKSLETKAKYSIFRLNYLIFLN